MLPTDEAVDLLRLTADSRDKGPKEAIKDFVSDKFDLVKPVSNISDSLNYITKGGAIPANLREPDYIREGSPSWASIAGSNHGSLSNQTTGAQSYGASLNGLQAQTAVRVQPAPQPTATSSASSGGLTPQLAGQISSTLGQISGSLNKATSQQLNQLSSALRQLSAALSSLQQRSTSSSKRR